LDHLQGSEAENFETGDFDHSSYSEYFNVCRGLQKISHFGKLSSCLLEMSHAYPHSSTTFYCSGFGFHL